MSKGAGILTRTKSGLPSCHPSGNLGASAAGPSGSPFGGAGGGPVGDRLDLLRRRAGGRRGTRRIRPRASRAASDAPAVTSGEERRPASRRPGRTAARTARPRPAGDSRRNSSRGSARHLSSRSGPRRPRPRSRSRPRIASPSRSGVVSSVPRTVGDESATWSVVNSVGWVEPQASPTGIDQDGGARLCSTHPTISRRFHPSRFETTTPSLTSGADFLTTEGRPDFRGGQSIERHPGPGPGQSEMFDRRSGGEKVAP